MAGHNNKVKLTVNAIKAVKDRGEDIILWDTEINGFGVKVSPKGRCSFFLYYRTIENVQRKFGIGVYPATKPEEARRIALLRKAEVSAGGDPSGDRKSSRAGAGTGTITEYFEPFLKSKAHLSSKGEMERVFRKDILPAIGSKRIESVTKQDVTALLDRVQKRAPVVARQVRAHLSSFYGWALPRLPNGAINPVLGAVKIPAPAARERELTEEELRALWSVLGTERAPWKDAIRLMILSGQRREEVLGADWREIDLAKATWTIPTKRVKNKKTQIVPLAPAVVGLFEATSHRVGRVFPKTSQTSRPAARIRAKLEAHLGRPVDRWRWHDFRRTVATGMQRLGVRLEVTEAVLNHIGGSRSGVVGIYQVHDWAEEKRAALDAWAREVSRIVG